MFGWISPICQHISLQSYNNNKSCKKLYFDIKILLGQFWHLWSIFFFMFLVQNPISNKNCNIVKYCCHFLYKKQYSILYINSHISHISFSLILVLKTISSHLITLCFLSALYIHYIVSLVHFFSLHPLITVVWIRVAALLPSTRNLVLCCLDVEKTVASKCEAMPVSVCLKLLLLSWVITCSVSGRSGTYNLETARLCFQTCFAVCPLLMPDKPWKIIICERERNVRLGGTYWSTDTDWFHGCVRSSFFLIVCFEWP